MLELLQDYSITEIISFLIVFAGATKGFFTFWDWAAEKLRTIFKKENQRLDNAKRIETLTEQQKKTDRDIQEILKSIQLLMQSDKDDIKAWITEKHHYFCYEKKYIDDYSLDCIEKRYTHYKDEGGNSFIDDLMMDLRRLIKVSHNRVEIKKGDINNGKDN